MSVIKILVAEDDILHAARLEMLLEQLDYSLVGICTNIADTLKKFKENDPDLVILDITLDGRNDGIELARQINQLRPTPIIFATSHDDRDTIRLALQEKPFAYLVKPVELGSLQAAIELAFHHFHGQPEENNQDWSEEFIISDSLFIKAAGKLQKVHLKDILWVEVAEDRYCELRTLDKKFHLRTSLQQLSEKLDPKIFLRIHRAYIINIHAIQSIDETDGYVEIHNKSIPVGNTYKNDLMKRLKLL